MTRLHWRVFILCALVALLDGFDTQSLGPAASAIADAIGVPVSDFGPVFSASQVGFLLGAMIFSALGDRLGRKRMLIAGTLLFAAASLGTAFVTSQPDLVLVRFIGGIGLGGATPNFISLASEYSPPTQRARIITLLWAAVPLGGMAGAFASAFTLPLFGWQTIFVIGCVLPLLLVPVLRAAMPESAELGLGGRTRGPARRNLASTFFDDGRALPTLLLWLASWMTWTTLVVVAFWTPPLLQRLGWSASAAASVLGALNGGGVVGTLIAGALLVRIPAHRALCFALFAAAAAIAALGGDRGPARSRRRRRRLRRLLRIGRRRRDARRVIEPLPGRCSRDRRRLGARHRPDRRRSGADGRRGTPRRELACPAHLLCDRYPAPDRGRVCRAPGHHRTLSSGTRPCRTLMEKNMSESRTITLIGHEEARAALDAAIAFAREKEISLSFVVVDGAGHLVACTRMDGAPFVTIEVARGKAFACIATGGQKGRQLRERYLEHPMVWGNIPSLGYGAPLLPAIGSEPIWRDGKLIGAMGASGGSADIDEEALKVAIEAIGATITP
jgi:uncharacterized protein GlcG (DUF336 family)/MFS family permease